MNSKLKVFQPYGKLNSTVANQLRKEINQISQAELGIILLDLQDVALIDNSGIGILVSIFKVVRLAGGKLVFCAANERVRILFEITGLDQVFVVFKDRSQFESLLSKLNSNVLSDQQLG